MSGLGVRAALLAALMDEYGGDAEDWTAMRSLSRVVARVEAALPAQAQAPEPQGGGLTDDERGTRDRLMELLAAHDQRAQNTDGDWLCACGSFLCPPSDDRLDLCHREHIARIIYRRILAARAVPAETLADRVRALLADPEKSWWHTGGTQCVPRHAVRALLDPAEQPATRRDCPPELMGAFGDHATNCPSREDSPTTEAGATKGNQDGQHTRVHPDRAEQVADGAHRGRLHGGPSVPDHTGPDPARRHAHEPDRGLTARGGGGGQPPPPVPCFHGGRDEHAPGPRCPECTCAMTEASLHTCERHGQPATRKADT